MAPKKGDKGKAKEVAKEPRCSTRAPFVIRSSQLGRDYSNLFAWVEGLIAAELRYERSRQDPLLRMPEMVNGKLYTLASDRVFLVTFRHENMAVSLLFQLRTLYFMAFHTGGVWYHLSDFDTAQLPLQSEFPYDGVVQLSFTSSYDNLGGTNINVSAMEFQRCVRELSRVGQYLDSDEIDEKLRSGPLAFPVISISEPLRFLLLRQWMKGTVARTRSSPLVPKMFTKYFRNWATFSSGFVRNEPVREVVDGMGNNEALDDVGSSESNQHKVKMISVDRLNQMLGILNSRDIKPVKIRWSDPPSSKMTEAPIRPSKAATQAVAKGSSNKGKDRNVGGYDTELSNVRARLNSPIITEKPNIKWNEIADLESSEQVLQEDVISPAKLQQILKDAQRPGMATLLYGPPGSGKSHLARSLADENDSTFLSICPSDFVSKCLEDSEKRVDDVFRKSRENAPSLIFIDEIDCLCGHCGESNGSEASKRIKTELLVQMQMTVHELAMRGFASKIAAPPVVKTDVLDVIAKQRPTVGIQDLEQYERFSREFGEQGQG